MKQFLQKKFNQFTVGNNDYRTLLKGAGQAFIIKSASALIAFFSQIILARLLGVENYGVYIYALTWINFLALVGKLGLDNSAKKFVSSYNQQKKWNLFRGYIQYSTLLSGVSGIIIALCVCIGIYIAFIYWNVSEELFITFLIASVILPVNILTQIGEATLQALKKVKEGLIPHFIVRPSLIIIFIILLGLLFNITISARLAMSINLGASVLVFLITYFFIYSKSPVKIFNKSKKHLTKRWLHVSLPLLFTTGFHVFLGQADILFLGLLKNTDVAGIYGAVSRIASVVFFGMYSVNIILAPSISEMHTEQKYDELQNFLKRAISLVIFFATPVTLVLFLGAKWILFLFGNEFTVGQSALYILLTSQYFSILAGSVTHLMNMTEHQYESVLILAITTVLNIIFNLLLIPRFGMEGAAAATGLSMIVWKLMMYIYIKNRMKLDPSILSIILR